MRNAFWTQSIKRTHIAAFFFFQQDTCSISETSERIEMKHKVHQGCRVSSVLVRVGPVYLSIYKNIALNTTYGTHDSLGNIETLHV